MKRRNGLIGSVVGLSCAVLLLLVPATGEAQKRQLLLTTAAAKSMIQRDEPGTVIHRCNRHTLRNIRCSTTVFGEVTSDIIDVATGEVVYEPVVIGRSAWRMVADVGLKGIRWVFPGEQDFPY